MCWKGWSKEYDKWVHEGFLTHVPTLIQEYHARTRLRRNGDWTTGSNHCRNSSCHTLHFIAYWQYALPTGTSLGTTKSFTMKMPSSPALVVAPKTQSTLSAAAKQLRNLHGGHKNHAPVHHQPRLQKPLVTSQAFWTSLRTSQASSPSRSSTPRSAPANRSYVHMHTQAGLLLYIPPLGQHGALPGEHMFTHTF